MAGQERVWEARTGTAPADEMLAYSESTEIDAQLIEADLAGSIAHALGLLDAGLLTGDEGQALVEGLQTLASKAKEGSYQLDPELEDVHMNVEATLEAIVGDPAAKLHAGRSRNDQVVLDLTLVTRAELSATAQALHDLATVLAETAQAHVDTPWTMQTHGQPAQPATLGFLFHAHALNAAQDVDALVHLLDEHDTSPLGAGAGAGSTLPIDPAFTADLLGLEPLDNALLAAGSRTTSLAAVHQLAQVGRHLEAMAVDLLDLAEDGAVDLPAAYTTGSSIMPHKVNPDALELARADASRLPALAHQLQAILAGRGLGYDRDLQRAKAPLLEALDVAHSTVAVLASVVDGLSIDPDPDAGEFDVGVATTDAVEALVEHGIAFRKAHQLVAQAVAEAGGDTSLADALEEADLPEAAHEAALEALDADPSARSTLGGPAPAAVEAALDELQDQLDKQADELAAAHQQATTYQGLLEAPTSALVAKVQEGSA